MVAYNLIALLAYRAAPIKSFPCQVIDRVEDGTMGYYVQLEDVDRNRHRINASRRQGEELSIGDVGVAEIRKDVLVGFMRFDL